MRIRNNVHTPWGAPDSEFEVKELDPTLMWHIAQGVLTVVDDD